MGRKRKEDKIIPPIDRDAVRDFILERIRHKNPEAKSPVEDDTLDMYCDSLDLVEIVLEAEVKWNKPIPEEDIDPVRSGMKIRDFIDSITKSLGSGNDKG